MNELLAARNLGKTYRKGPAGIEVLRGLDLGLSPSESVAVVGASGVGKSTLLHLLGALDRPTSGELEFEGEPIFRRSHRRLAEFRNRCVGFIFQFHYLMPEFTALENVSMPLLMRRVPKPRAEEAARALLERVGLKDRLTHRPTELSGGEQQRVAIARALVGEPAVVLADEPTGNLDVETARSVGDLLFGVVKDRRKSLVVATHNPEVALRADRVFELKDGKLWEKAGRP